MRKPPPQRQKKALRGKLQSNRQKLSRVEEQLRVARRSEEEIMADLTQVEARMKETRLRLSETKVRLAHTQAEQRRVAGMLATSQKELSAVEYRLAERMAANYRQGPVRYASVVLGSHTMGEMVSRAQLVRSIVKYEATLIAEIKAGRESVLQWKAALDARARDVQHQTTELAQRQEDETQAVQRRRQVLSEAQSKRLEIEAEYAALAQDSQEVIARLRALEATTLIRGVFTGRLAQPVAGRMVSGFGPRFHPILHYTRLHSGVDFGAESGTPIVAAADGTVAYAGTMRGYGNVVVVDHGSGISTLYAHCSVLLASDGQRVRQGEVIARVGATGLATGPHLHFEVRKNGTPINPIGNGL